MKRAGLLAACLALCTAPLAAREYFASKGVYFHIGDSRFELSSDLSAMGTYPVVGTEWVQDFTVDRPDRVRVRIDKVFGVDDCPYCKVIVGIGSTDMGRLTQENNHEPFSTLAPLAFRVQPGRKYSLRIASYASQGRADDFIISNVVVETDEAEVTFLPGPNIRNLGDPAPTPMARPEPSAGDCRGNRRLSQWLPATELARGVLEISSLDAFSQVELAAAPVSGEFVEFFGRVKSTSQGRLLDQALELVFGDGPQSGWVLSFPPGGAAPRHANLKHQGVYRAKKFNVGAFKGGKWNSFRVARCPDGSASLFLNGQELGEAIALKGPTRRLVLRARGLSLEFASNPY